MIMEGAFICKGNKRILSMLTYCGRFFGFGVGAGANVLLRYAVENPEEVRGAWTAPGF